MPWFITSICGKETMEKMAKGYADIGKSHRLPSRKRTFGFYNSYNEAHRAVTENRCNLCECLYDYVVVEYIEEGIHPMVHAVDWWRWDQEKNRWIYLPQKDWPEEFQSICNWALG